MSEKQQFLSYRTALGLAVLSCLVASCYRQVTPATDQSTPEATLRAMYRALEQSDAELLASLIDPNDPTRNGMPEVLRRMKSIGVTYELVNLEVFVTSNDGTTALMSASEHARLRQGDKVLSDTEGAPNFTLRKVDGKWYLVGLGQWPSPGFIQP